MLDEKEINIIKKNAEKLIQRGEILKGEKSKFTDFFLNNSNDSLDAAKLLYDISTNQELKKSMGFPNFNGYLWVINASYYSMFYAARALLEKEGIKLKTEQSTHVVTFYALVYFFYISGKIEKRIIEELKNAGEEASELLGKERSKKLVEDYFNEKDKRGRFTYEMGEIAMQSKAKTSLERAKIFNTEIRKIIEG